MIDVTRYFLTNSCFIALYISVYTCSSAYICTDGEDADGCYHELAITEDGCLLPACGMLIKAANPKKMHMMA